MAPLPLGPAPGDDLFRRRDPRLGLGQFGPDGMQTCACGMSKGEVRVGCNGLLQGLRGTGPSREQQVDAQRFAATSDVVEMGRPRLSR